MLIRDFEQEANIVVLVKGLFTACRNVVHVEIEDLALPSERKGLEILHARFLFRLASCRGKHVGLAIRMATQLQPAPELSVVRQECGTVFPRNDPGRRGDMTGKTIAMKTSLDLDNQSSNPFGRGDLVGMTFLIAIQKFEKVRAIHQAKLAATALRTTRM